MKKYVPYGSEEQIALVLLGWITLRVEEIVNEITGEVIKMAVMSWNPERNI